VSIAIIPARGGSRRIPNKNIKVFAPTGRTMLAMAVSTARSAGIFDQIYVSSDDEATLKIALGAGAVPLPRSAELGQDDVGTQQVVQSAITLIEELNGQNLVASHVCCIYPCTPLLRPVDIATGYRMFTYAGKPFLVAAGLYPSPIHQALEVTANSMRLVMPQFEGWPSIKFPERYFDAGQFYWGTAEAFRSGLNLYSNAAPYILQRHCAIDINTLEDWWLAELIYRGLEAAKNVE
tara:strand:- start:34470 stop:35177 length:708 start_codon:yes stop_codon:yes gene_type:complete